MTKHSFRLAIGTPAARQSSVWRLWSNRKGDLYVANRCLGGIYKASLHRDRKCQFGFTESYKVMAAKRFDRVDRHLEKWTLPEAVCIRALQILIPASELRKSAKKETKVITWLPTPPSGSIGTISLFITEKGLELSIPNDPEDAWIVGKLETEIRSAWITYAFTKIDDRLGEVLVFEKDRLKSTIGKSTVPSGTRVSLWDSGNHHERQVLELACDFV